MHALSAAELLAAWEGGREQLPVQRALLLLAAACSETPVDELARLSLGRRDALLLTLREWTFGPRLTSVVTCGSCGVSLELAFDAADLRVAAEDEPADSLALRVAEYQVRFRLPTSLDLAGVAGSADTTSARSRLIERCLLSARHGDEMLAADRLPDHVVVALAERMAQADPQADIQLALACPGCDRRWLAAFDIASFLWSEIDAWARRILREVHILASAYHWREADILSLSPWRRRYYLDMVQG